MLTTITVFRYPKQRIFFALCAMGMFRLPLYLNRKISFFKLMGCGKNGTFDKTPDWQQWAILAVHSTDTVAEQTNLAQSLYGSFISKWLTFFKCETWTVFLQPEEGHGKWDRKEPFVYSKPLQNDEGPVAILTRATIRFSGQKNFWSNVDAVAGQMAASEGFITSIGIGEMPFIKQATFSIWKNREYMKNFAYRAGSHHEVIKKTRKENWYSEEMFARFKPVRSYGSIKGFNPLEGML